MTWKAMPRRWRVQSRKGPRSPTSVAVIWTLPTRPRGLDQQVALAALKPLGAVVAVWPLVGGLDALAVQDGRAGVGGRPCLVRSLYVEAERLDRIWPLAGGAGQTVKGVDSAHQRCRGCRAWQVTAALDCHLVAHRVHGR